MSRFETFVDVGKSPVRRRRRPPKRRHKTPPVELSYTEFDVPQPAPAPWEGGDEIPPPPVPDAITLATVVHPDNLKLAYWHCAKFGGQAPGLDRVRYTDLSSAGVWEASHGWSEAVLDRTYRPQPTRNKKRKKPKGGTRTIKIAGIMDRVLASAVLWALKTHFARRSGNPVKYWRRSSTVRGIQARIQVYIENQRGGVVGQDDIRDAFGHVRVADVTRLMRAAEVDEGLVQLTAIILGGETAIGIPQGCPLSSWALDLVMDEALDQRFSNMGTTSDPLYSRYADDIVCVGNSVPSVTTLLDRIDTCLSDRQYELKGRLLTDINTQPVEDVLGRRLAYNRKHVLFGPADRAYAKLGDKLLSAHKAENPPQRALWVLRGWIASYAPVTERPRDHAQRILSVLARYGFSGLAKRSEILGWLYPEPVTTSPVTP